MKDAIKTVARESWDPKNRLVSFLSVYAPSVAVIVLVASTILYTIPAIF